MIHFFKSLKYTVLIGLLFISCAEKHNFTQFVDPMIGTDEDGHTFPGVVLPNGMVQLGPDTRSDSKEGPHQASSGYHYLDKSILGFSHTRYSGTGRGDGGDFLFMPTTGNVQLIPGEVGNTSSGYRSSFSHANEVASPGYYKVLLDDYNVIAELTATKRVGLHKYDFQDATEGNIVLDLQHGIDNHSDDIELKVINNKRIVGYRSSLRGLRRYQKLFFTAEFSEAFSSYGMLVDGKELDNEAEGKGRSLKAYFKFSLKEQNKTILVKVAYSKVNIEGAEKNLEEIEGWDFESVRKKASKSWNDVLQKIAITTPDVNQKKIFYTALYHTYIHPSLSMDVDGQYRSANNKVYIAEGFTNYTNFSLWDTFRGVHPLLTILNPSMVTDFIRTFIERYENSGNLPIFELSGNKIHSMIGYHSLSVIADAYVKDIRDYNVSKALEGMKKLSNLPWEKRNVFKTYGFVPYNFTHQSVSRTLEYSYDDWCIAQIAKDFTETDFQHYSNRGNFYKNNYSAETGFMTPRNSMLEWLQEFDPKEFSDHYTQANAFQYSSFVPQDIPELVKISGGPQKFENWLDTYFTTTISGHESQLGQYQHGNEPSHHTAYLYNFIGAPWKTQEKIHEILTSQYGTGPDGLSGNDDAGQMSAWYIFSSMGFYSVTPGLDYYVIGAPQLETVSISLENRNKFEIKTENFGKENIYIQAVYLNGQPYTKSYISHDAIRDGGTMVFEMGSELNENYGTRKEDMPYALPFESASLVNINVEGIETTPDGIVSFEKICTVSMTTDEENTNIHYTLDGTEPSLKSKRYEAPLTVKKSTLVKAKGFRESVFPSYTTQRKLKKLDFKPAVKQLNVKKGIAFAYSEVWLCLTVEDIDTYPIVEKGVTTNVNGDLKRLISRNFGVTYSGYIDIPRNGIYTFYLDSDDGSRLFIDDEVIVNNDGSHRSRQRKGKIALKKGLHKIAVKHFQEGGRPFLELQWETSGLKKQIIPESAYFYKKIIE